MLHVINQRKALSSLRLFIDFFIMTIHVNVQHQLLCNRCNSALRGLDHSTHAFITAASGGSTASAVVSQLPLNNKYFVFNCSMLIDKLGLSACRSSR